MVLLKHETEDPSLSVTVRSEDPDSTNLHQVSVSGTKTLVRLRLGRSLSFGLGVLSPRYDSGFRDEALMRLVDVGFWGTTMSTNTRHSLDCDSS